MNRKIVKYLLICPFFLLYLSSSNAAVTLDEATIRSQLKALSERSEPYLLFHDGPKEIFVEKALQFDPSYLDTLETRSKVISDAQYGLYAPIFAHLTNPAESQKEAISSQFWANYNKQKERATLDRARRYQGAALREVWRWLINYHFTASFGYSTEDQKNELFDYTSEIAEILYNSDGIATAGIPRTLSNIGGINDYSKHNYHAENIAILMYYAMVFPDAPNAAEYLMFGLREFENLMAEGVYDGGAWNESPRYQGAILRILIPVLADVKALFGIDQFENTNFKAMLRWLMLAQTQTVNDSIAGDSIYGYGRIPAVGDSIWTREWYLWCLYAAKHYKDTSPKFARNLMYAWEQAGSPTISNLSREAFTVADFDLSIAPVPHSRLNKSFVLSQRKGHVVMQSDRGDDNQQWVFFRSGETSQTVIPISRHEHADHNGFSLFSFGYPVVLDPGISRYTEGGANNYRAAPVHSTVDFAKHLDPNPLFTAIWSEEDMEHTIISGEIKSFTTNDQFDLVIGRAEKDGWHNGFPFSSPENYTRQFFFAKPNYFVIRDDISDEGVADYYLNLLAQYSERDSRGNEVVFNHDAGFKLKVIFLNHKGVQFEIGETSLADVPEWGDRLTQLKAERRDGRDGFVTLIYPYRDKEPDLNAFYNGSDKISVIRGEWLDEISFQGDNWSMQTLLAEGNTHLHKAGHLYHQNTLSGGPHGDDFDDFYNVQALLEAGRSAQPVRVEVRAGRRVDSIQFHYDNYSAPRHGGSGGSSRGFTLNPGQTIKEIHAYNGQRSNRTRVFGLKFVLNDGTEYGPYGSTTNDVTILGGENGADIVGLHGRSGSELDRLGVVLLAD
ncbi:jacalin-like lectin [Marinibactrum halimedae]|uniref:Jacalin-type lectin domain-containing protein n=1 Tax=Marinibactrum halimedae TaxID=1444977 RepID=A0AA37T8J0_9GAMM|nr:jacalin-like lectin [Marinibactrum halimedae]MCD9459386.1 heparinase II/III family protein [Marinibactrum halimedae]GLS27549.1 hypothetical protein GCM10007877_32680 [Marinibactrum halimedae]